jgi:hypothetical protein
MNFKETVEAIMVADPLQAVLLMANHGMGKSDCVRQAVKLLGVPCIDIRLSQADVGDLKGMPFQVNGRTYFAPPDFFPLAEEDAEELSKFTGQKVSPANANGGILFLDEFNRATREVQQAAFEIILDHRLNMRRMPDNWKVVAAINEDADLYLVNEMCPATTDRFFIIDFRPDQEEWFEWAKNEGKIHDAVYQFLRKYIDFLDPSIAAIKESTQKGVKKIHGRRSWHHFSRTIYRYETAFKDGLIKTEILNKKDNLDLLYIVAQGHVGAKAAAQFKSFIETDYQALDANVILNAFDESIALRLKAIVDASRIPELTAYNVMITEYAKDKLKGKKFNDKQSANLLRYIEICPNEVVSDFWKKFNGECREISSDWYKKCGASPDIKKRILGVFEAPNLKKQVSSFSLLMRGGGGNSPALF